MRPSRMTTTRSASRQELRQLRGDHEDRRALRAELADEPVDLGLGADVDAARRLVEDAAPAARARATWPSTTFCWLPPESVPTGCVDRRRADRAAARRSRCAERALRGADRRSRARDRRSRMRSVTLSRPANSSTSAVPVAVLRHVDDARARWPRRGRAVTRLAVRSRSRRASAGVERRRWPRPARCARRRSARPRPTISPARSVRSMSRELAGARQAADARATTSPASARRRGEARSSSVAADHQPHELLGVELGRRRVPTGARRAAP